ncbi:GNAT family N-acetyltransferase [Ruminococcus sp.]|uniref:GNAT family N-acetyltransferase n=1 Tax=Ruminococcus sp. TaxID=41978 RepID=UPI0025DD1B79|nr:GNAT family N-acetyltransferase [Ruminococcus sp.]MBQ8967575.1 GNAT family N-acetyltransferase [Ruminococcus sp.]
MEILKTERLTVRKFRAEDHEDMAEILTDDEVTFFEPYPAFTKEACVKEAENFEKSDEFFAVVLGDKVIGKIYFSKRNFGTWEIGYTFNKSYQGKGYAAECLKAFMGYGFDKLGARRIIAEIDTRNTKSENLAKRLGMRKEAEHREIYPDKFDNTKFNDFYLYAMLSSEYKR